VTVLDAIHIGDHVYQQSYVEEFRDFAGPSIPAGCWKTHYAFDGPMNRTLVNNGEMEFYVDPNYRGTADRPLGINPFSVRDGKLTIEARPTPPDLQPFLYDYRYTSGALINKGCFEQQYGYFEMRARFPKGKGLWPAFWLMPSDGSWPPEIDVVEVLGHEPDRIYQSAHGEGGSNGVVTGPDSSAGFHDYGVEWTPTEINWYIDRKKTRTLPNFVNKPMYMLVNLAVGGHWPGAPDASTRFPAVMQVEYVKAFKEVAAKEVEAEPAKPAAGKRK
jgi:beta-glucanase (GH16 family)